MPTATGFVKSVPGVTGQFYASFYVNDILYTASGSIPSPIPPFSSNEANLTYDDEGDLTSTRSFSGRIGVTEIQLVFNNGPTITGILDIPIDPPSTVSGRAVWTQS